MVNSSKDTQIAPFLSKCYAMVDDPCTDSIVSWSSTGTSFVIWDVPKLEQQLLPKYYKHRNFSSFNRQLNQYGFKKFDPDRWEFTNDGFIKGQKHMLRNITRKKAASQGNFQHSQSLVSNLSLGRKSSQGNSQEMNTSRMKPSNGNCLENHLREKNNSSRKISSQVNSEQNLSQGTDGFTGARVEVGDLRLWEEVEILKKDKNVVMQELTKLSHNQQGADSKLLLLGEQLQGMEISQQQMLSFLVMVVQKPGFLGKLLQQNESHWHISETNKKRPYLALEQGAAFDELLTSEAQIVKYQPLRTGPPKPLLLLPSNNDDAQDVNLSATGFEDFFTKMDLMDAEKSMSVPVEEDGCDENVGQIVIPDMVDDMMLERLLASPNSAANVESQSLARFAEELGLLISESDNEDEEN